MSEIDEALAHVRAGRTADAEGLIRDALRAVAAESGEASAPYAARLFDLATVFLASGDLTRAVEPLRRAVELRIAGDREAEKARLTYAMNLGELFHAIGRFDEAERVLRESLADRAALYGKAHGGYAYGLESLAVTLRARKSLDEAREAIDTAIDVFLEEGNPRVAAAIAARAPIATATRHPAFEIVARLPEELIDALVNEVLAREPMEEPAVHLTVLEQLRAAVRLQGGDASRRLPPIVAAIARAARAAGADEAQREAVQWLTARLEASGWGESPSADAGAPAPEAATPPPIETASAPPEPAPDDAEAALAEERIAVSEALWALVAPKVAVDLVDALRVAEGGKIEVRLARDPSPDEAASLDRALRDAVATLRARARVH